MKRIAIVAFLAWTVGCGSPQEEGPQRPAQGAIQVGASEPSRVDEGPPTPVDQ